MGKRWLLLGAFGLALVVNPYLACSESSSGESDFVYSEADMKQAVLGSWQGTAEIDGVSTPFSLSLEQGGNKTGTRAITSPRAQPQCGSRSFVKPAAACVSVTTMPVVGTLSSENPALNGAVDGDLSAFRTLDAVELQLRLDGGPLLGGQIRDQALSEGKIQDGGSNIGSFSLSRP
ncbi:MAG TPA: hypothetical protein VEQ58_08980 [Polyangiaceae bacterium]|nr:hypothetical protein [Polyangiaceae bacterium]